MKFFCLKCLLPCDIYAVDEGIGAYEYGSVRESQKDIVIRSKCCDSYVVNEYNNNVTAGMIKDREE